MEEWKNGIWREGRAPYQKTKNLKTRIDYQIIPSKKTHGYLYFAK